MKKLLYNFKLKSRNYFTYLLFFSWELTSYPQPYVLESIDWNTIVSARQLGDHPVFKITLPDGDLIAKIQSNAVSAKEIYAALIAKEILSRAEVPNMRILQGNEKKQFHQKMKALKISLNGQDIAGDIVIMDFMDGTDLDEGQHLIKSKGIVNLDRLKSLGQLYAYNLFILGADRFLLTFSKKADLPYNGLARNDNIRFSNKSSKIQAIDNTIRDGLKFELVKDTQIAAQHHKQRIEPQIDELIFALDGNCQITRALEKQIGVGDLGAKGRQAIKDGVIEGIISIGFSEVNFALLLTKSLSTDVIESSALLTEKDKNKLGYTQFLSLMRQFFREKAYLSSKIAAIKNEVRSTILISLPHIAAKLMLNEAINKEEKALLKSYDRSVGEKIAIASEKRQRKYSIWPKELITMDDDKDRIDKMTDNEKENLLKSIIKLAPNLSDNNNDEVIKDFAYIAATSLLHLLQ